MNPRLTARDGLILACLSGLLFSIYLFTFSGRYISDDELFLIDTVESLARRGSIFLTETGGLKWPGETLAEPLHPLLASPLFWLADRLPFVGNVHAVMLFNPLVTVATAALVYLFVVGVDYPRRVAVAAALTFGLATIAWPYTKNFFREPLTGLALFATAYLLLRWRRASAAGETQALIWLGGAAVTGGLSLLTKEAALFVLPVLAIVFGPWSGLQRVGGKFLRTRREALQILAAFAGVAVLAALGLWLYQTVLQVGLDRYSQPPIWGLENGLFSREVITAFVGPLVSPGKSLFLYSPAFVLMAVALAPRAAGDNGRPTIGLAWPISLMAIFALAYAVARGELWWGGTGWGPRYMVPLTPFFVLAVTPALNYVLSTGASVLARVGAGLLLSLSLLVQAAGVIVFPLDYYSDLERSGAGVAWTVGLWDPIHSAILTHLRLISAGLPDFAWARARAAGPDWKLAALIAVFIAAFTALLVWSRNRQVSRRIVLGGAAGGLLALLALTGVFLWRIYPDRRYRGDDAGLQAMRQYWETTAESLPDRALFLNNLTYFDFVLNYSKDAAPFYTLPLSPGDHLAPGASAPPPSTDPTSLTYTDARSIAEYFPTFYRTAGFFMETGPYHTHIVRSLEWWMAETYYHIGTHEFAPEVRLLTYSTARAPKPAQAPAHTIEAHLGESLTLAGFDVQPDQATYAPGDILNISIQWLADDMPSENYTASIDLIGPGQALILQHDSFPLAGFWPTSAFVPGQPVRDNVAFVLANDLPPGRYQVWALMYDSAVQRLPVTGPVGAAGDHVLLLEFEVR